MIELEHVAKTFPHGAGSVHALEDIHLTIAQGEFVAIRGASGSGKSTLLNVLGCLDVVSAGRYRLGGRDVAHLSDPQRSRLRARVIGFVFQAFNLLPRTTALENVELPMIYAHGRIDRQRAAGLLERMGLGARLRHVPSQLSGGEQQRVSVARALVNDPPLLLADEPTGNLDAQAGAELLAIFDQLHEEGRTIVLVTHDEAVAARADRQIHLRAGRIEPGSAVRRGHDAMGA